MTLFRLLLLSTLIAFASLSDEGGHLDPNGGGAMDPNGGTQVGSAIDPDGVSIDAGPRMDPNG